MKHLLPKARSRRGVRALAAAAGATVAVCLTAGSASAAVTLDWTVENAFQSGCSTTGLNCTWLGHVTNPTPFSGANGTVTVDGDASITDPGGLSTGSITPVSARGAGEIYSFTYPAGSGVIDTEQLSGTMTFDGVVSFVAPPPPPAPPPNGHGFTITVDNPRIELDGEGGGQLFATGLHTPGAAGSTPVPYDDDEPIWNLDLSRATWNVYADGTRTLSCIVPSIATAGHVFPGNYGVGAGPNRTPNIFGSFELRISPYSSASPELGLAPRPAGGCAPEQPITPPEAPIPGPAGPAGPVGPKGPEGAKGPEGQKGTTTIERIQVAVLAKAPFGKGSRKVRVLKKGKLVARGTVKGKTVRVKLAKGAGKRLKGKYVLRVVGGKARAVVRLG